ncbi:hypothetical protein [Gaetbulibacter jejuensis]|uniref:hypothetical protein n=1 Tax=Gaetbulibacter jejuensis TaxID=584607 RepID=UPI00300B90DF
MKKYFYLLLFSLLIISCKKNSEEDLMYSRGIISEGNYTNNYFGFTLNFEPQTWSIVNKDIVDSLSENALENVFDNVDEETVEVSESNPLLVLNKTFSDSEDGFTPSFTIIAEDLRGNTVLTAHDYIEALKQQLLFSNIDYKINDSEYPKIINGFKVSSTNIFYRENNSFQDFIAFESKRYCVSFLLTYRNLSEKKQLKKILYTLKQN